MSTFLALVIPVIAGLHLHALHLQLQPQFNSLPLNLHPYLVWVSYALLGAVGWRSRRGEPLSRSAALCAAATACAMTAMGGRIAGSAAARQLGPEWGALLARVGLGCCVTVPAYLTSRKLWFIPPLLTPAAYFAVAQLDGIGNCIQKPETIMIALAALMSSGVLFTLHIDEVEEDQALAPPPPPGAKPKPPPKSKAPIGPVLILLAIPLCFIATAWHMQKSVPYTDGAIRIHSSVRSNSGRIVVGDNMDAGYRVLRADHSLLGGVWIRQREDGEVDLGDSVFAAFPLQEIALLAWPAEKKGRELVIGLGAGIGTVYATRRGWNVDVVEYDEAVYKAAHEYFGLKRYPPKNVSIADGADFVRAAAERRSDKWDLVVQDCFTAGGIPVELFTMEFWTDVKAILRPGGLVSMTPAAIKVIRTLTAIFPHCRGFRDAFASKTNDGVQNIVFVCSAEQRPEFRPPTEGDIMGSPVRNVVYREFLQHEAIAELAPMAEPGEAHILRRGEQLVYGEWDRQLSLESWNAIEAIMPARMWTAW